jgi:hypothetical protein
MPLGECGARILSLGAHVDARGTLVVGECGGALPFSPMRFFLVHGVPPGGRRGGHAVVNCDELLVAAAGAISIGLHDGREEHVLRLDSPRVALYLPRDTFCWQFDFSPGAVLLVLASELYQNVRYVDDLEAYRRTHAVPGPL